MLDCIYLNKCQPISIQFSSVSLSLLILLHDVAGIGQLPGEHHLRLHHFDYSRDHLVDGQLQHPGDVRGVGYERARRARRRRRRILLHSSGNVLPRDRIPSLLQCSSHVYLDVSSLLWSDEVSNTTFWSFKDQYHGNTFIQWKTSIFLCNILGTILPWIK